MRHIISCYNLRVGRRYAERLENVQPGDCVFVTDRHGAEFLQGLDVKDMVVHRVEGQTLPYYAFEILRSRCHHQGLAIGDLYKKGAEWPKRR